MDYTWYHRYKQIIQITGVTITASVDAIFKGGKEKSQLLWYHLRQQYTETPVSVPGSSHAFFETIGIIL